MATTHPHGTDSGSSSQQVSDLPHTFNRMKKSHALDGVRKELAALSRKPMARGKNDKKRRPCYAPGCPTEHLKGSDYCFEHDNGRPPR